MNTNSLLTTNKWLKDAVQYLDQAGIATARLDCLVLLEDITGIDRAALLAEPKRIIESSYLKKLNSQIEQRKIHTPLAYIRGRTEFYGREFRINHFVLEPRPESETMINMLKQLPDSKNTVIVDIGSGSGALAVTAKLEIPESQVIATDIDLHCLSMTARNSKKHQAKINLRLGSLLDPIADISSLPLILLCNLPYVPDSFKINPAALQEPRQAIFGGPDGLDIYRGLFIQLQSFHSAPLFVLTESMPPQHEDLAVIARNNGFVLEKSDDFIQQFSRA
jgi:release factor glutamine methyltransferase